LVPTTGIYAPVLKAAQDGDDWGLVHFGLYEALCDQIDLHRDELEADARGLLVKHHEVLKRAVVRTYMQRRLENEDVDDLLEVAKGIADYEPIIKDDNQQGWKPYLHPRDQEGRFVRILNGLRAFTGRAPLMTSSNPQRVQGMEDVVNQLPNQAQAHQIANTLTTGTRYQQLGTLGRGLSQVSQPGSPGHAAGILAEVGGQLGPEVERVLGPGMRRTAYRYRGTEVTPDPQLQQDVNEATVRVKMAQSGGVDPSRDVTSRQTLSPGHGAAAANVRLARQNSSSYLMQSRADAVAAVLARKLPDQNLTRFSIAAGRTPPSQGVIINEQGKVASQAVGATSDHYLPFNLGNLSGLHGGQYVRTRAVGGPTTEDLYAGLLAGAREITVVSNSGVYSVEFQPDLRGGRRYSDKARDMIDRYGRLLEAINNAQNNKLFRSDLKPEVKRRLHEEAMNRADGDAETGERLYEIALTKERNRQAIGEWDEEDLASQAKADAEAEPGYAQMSRPQQAQRVAEIKMDAQRKMRENRVEHFKLDGEGYALALNSLRQEFPQYIKSTPYTALPEFMASRGQRDVNIKPFFGADRNVVGRTNLMSSTQAQAYGVSVRTGSKQTKEEREAEEKGTTATGTGGTGSTARTNNGTRAVAAVGGGTGLGALGGAGGGGGANAANNAVRFNMAANQSIKRSLAPLTPMLINGLVGAKFNGAAEQLSPDDMRIIQDAQSPTALGDSEMAFTWLRVHHRSDTSEWLTNTASPDELRRIAEASQAMVDSLENVTSGVSATEREAVNDFSKQINALYYLKQPRTTPTGSDVLLTTPKDDSPLAIPSIDQAYTKQDLDKVARENPDVTEAVKVFKQRWPDDNATARQIAGDISDRLYAILYAKTEDPANRSTTDLALLARLPEEQKEIRQLQLGWAFTSRQNAIETLGGQQGGSPPLGIHPTQVVSARDSRPRQQVVLIPPAGPAPVVKRRHHVPSSRPLVGQRR
jgi:hypothetical protein